MFQALERAFGCSAAGMGRKDSLFVAVSAHRPSKPLIGLYENMPPGLVKQR